MREISKDELQDIEDKTELRKLIEYDNKFHRVHEGGEIKEEAEMGQA